MATAKKKYPYSITEVCMTFLHKNRFYATILAKMVKISTNVIPTAGVGFNGFGKLTLYYNPDFLLNMSLEKAQTVLEHEVLHVFFRHLTRHPKEGTKTSKYLDDIKNTGCDISINQYLSDLPTVGDSIDQFLKMLEESEAPAALKKKIQEEIAKMPTDRSEINGHTPESHGFEKEKSADWYIEELKKKYPPTQCGQCGQPNGTPSPGKKQKQKQGQGKGQPDPNGQPQQGKGQGQEPGDSGEGEGEGEGQSPGHDHGEGEGGGNGKHECPDCGAETDGKGDGPGLGEGFDSHDLWDKVLDGETGKITDVEDLDFDPEYETVSIVQKAIKECKDFGNLPAFVRREIEELQKPINRYNWKHELKVFVNSMLAVSKRLSQKRVNRRFAGAAYILPGKKKSRRPSILVARDTSGSVFDDATQKEFENEMINISKFATIHVADCDTIIHQTYKVRKATDFLKYKGGGGTSFEPVFKKAKELGVDGIIYITDTYGSFPKKEDIGKFAVKTIWCTIDQEKVEIPFGKHVNIPIKTKS